METARAGSDELTIAVAERLGAHTDADLVSVDDPEWFEGYGKGALKRLLREHGRPFGETETKAQLIEKLNAVGRVRCPEAGFATKADIEKALESGGELRTVFAKG